MKKQNILFLTNDEHRWDFCTGGLIDGLKTPTIDRLKGMGVSLPNTISNCPICMPTRFTWLTGLYASQSPSGPRNGKDWPEGHPTVAHALQRAGYTTAVIGKLHSHEGRSMAEHHLNDLEPNQRARGFDYVFQCNGAGGNKNKGKGNKGCRWTDYIKSKGNGLYEKLLEDSASRDHRIGGKNLYSPSLLPAEDRLDSFVTDEAVRWLSTYDSEKPFFLHASLFGPHFPHDPPEPFFSRHRPEDMPIPIGVDDPEKIKYWREQRAAYCGMVEFNDYLLGKIIDALEARGLLKDTLIIFSTDHGDMMGDYGLFYKIHPYDASIRTPTIVCDPASKLPGGTVLNDMVEAVDMPATILEAASDEHLQEAMPTSPAKSFLKYTRGEQDSHRQQAYCEHGNFSEESGRIYRLIREQEWKYVYYSQGDMLFNVNDDPYEQNNLIDDPSQQERVSKMRGDIIRRMASVMVPPATVTSKMPIAFYKALYP